MVWIVVAVLLAALTGYVFASGGSSMNIPREPDREGMQDNEAAQAYDRVSRWRVFALSRSIVLRSLANMKPRGLLVDIGCGPGYLAARIGKRYSSLRVVGLDISGVMIKIARRNWPLQRYGAQFLAGDAHYLPFHDNSVDFVLSSLSLHHWSNAAVVFREINRVLKPGGQLLVFDLRRDAPRLFYYMLRLGQAWLAPGAIRRTNGAVGSFWASYTVSELEAMLSEIQLCEWQVKKRLGWITIYGVKVEK